jgi:hypothetical protein
VFVHNKNTFKVQTQAQEKTQEQPRQGSLLEQSSPQMTQLLRPLA